MTKPLDTFVRIHMTSVNPLQMTIYRKQPHQSDFEQLLTGSREVVFAWLKERDFKLLIGTSIWFGSGEVLQGVEPIDPHAYQNNYGSIDNTLMMESNHA